MPCDKTTEDLHESRRSSASVGEVGPRPERASDAHLGRRLGAYRIERLLARGGMGRVYLAIREDEYEQRVALKLIDPDRFSTRSLDRFYRERQILARLEHPHVARILDGGTDDNALPYLVMEFVEGEPIDRYCDGRQLPLAARLELFRTVCEAVHFAHQNLVVHRDIKPSNILVTGDGVVKLLDFGIAKILGDERFQPDLRTVTGQWPMTPSYASPEQIQGQAISTASDVYSLGVLLCRLVSGGLPYRLRDSSPGGLMEAICRAEPTRPSYVLQHNDKQRIGRPWLAHQLAGDIDAITLKAMRKEPRERYASALQLAEDVERHLVGRPIEARRGSWLYYTGKLVRRHKVGLVALSLVVALAVISTILWRQAVHERAQAELSQQRAEAVAEFLEDLFETADPDVTGGDSPTLRQALDRGREQLAGRLVDEPEIRADLLGTLATVYARLGLYSEARELREEALRIRLAASDADRPELASDLNNLGGTLHRLGEHAAAESYSRQALEMWRRLGDEPNEELALRNLVATLMQQGRGAEALPLHLLILERQRALYEPGDARIASGLYSLGALYRQRGEPEKAEPLLRQALVIYAENYGWRHTTVANVQNSLGRVLQARGRHDEARELFELALETRLGLLGEEHEKVASSRKNLASLLLDMGDTKAAGQQLVPALATLRRVLPVGDWRIADAESVWGSYLMHLGNYAEAEPLLLASHEALRGIKGENDVVTRDARRRLEALHRFLQSEEAPRSDATSSPPDS